MTVLIACFGNVLRGDDGFGRAVCERLLAESLPPDVTVMEAGIGGIHFVQELMRGVDMLLVVDAVDLGRPAGTVIIQVPDVPDVTKLPLDQRRDQLADMHYATPEKAMMLARGLGVLPDKSWVVGVQTTETDWVGVGLSEPTALAVDIAVAEIRRLIELHHPQVT